MTPSRHRIRSTRPTTTLSLERLEDRTLPAATVLYRVNAGGPALTGSPGWEADTGQYTNASAAGSSTFADDYNIDMSDVSVPAGTPLALFQSERWDSPGGAEMQWDFAVASGTYDVRLYFAEIYFVTAPAAGQRVFDVSIEGSLVLDNYDITADVGIKKAVAKTFRVTTADGNLDIDFAHVVENPNIKGIEILSVDTVSQANKLGVSSTSLSYGNVTTGTTTKKTLTLTNLGGAGDPSIVVDATTITGTNAALFSDTFNDAANLTLAPGQSATIDVNYSPTTVGSHSASLAITHSGSNSPLVVSLAGTGQSPASTVLYRVNAGGPALTGSPGWEADTGQYTNASAAGSSTFADDYNIDMSDVSVPAGTPMALFQSERWDSPGGAEMQWDFAVASGTYDVRLYFAEIYFVTAPAAGQRVFDVSIEGSLVLDNYDITADVGIKKAVAKTFRVTTADGNLDIDFAHVVENPTIKGIEILSVTPMPNTLGVSPGSLSYGNVTTGTTTKKKLTLTNLGGAGDPSIIVDATTITGTNAALFSDTFNDAANLTLAPGQSATIDVNYSPTTVGSHSASLAITHSGSNSPLVVPLAGTGANTVVPIGFGKSQLTGANLTNPTSLQFGPDGRLYVAQQNGLIKAYTIARNSANSYAVTATETITLIQSITNHDDNGAVNASVTGRLVTGLLVAGTAANPVIYVTSSDPRISYDGADLNLDTNSGILSRLTWDGVKWVKLDLVRGLPRSEENHSSNGIALNTSTNTLYIAQGGHTNMGAPSNNFALLPEYALSAAILSVDLNAIGNSTYDLPTLDDENRAGSADANDPFGGDDGKNQAKLVAGGPVQVYAPGFRNPYDIVISQSGKMYTIDNGPNAGWGDVPLDANGQPTTATTAEFATNTPHEPGVSYPDQLHLITGQGYYGGHPNPTRANLINKFNTNNPQSPVTTDNPIEGSYLVPGVNDGSIAQFGYSTNGLVEYTASNFGGALQGNLLAASFGNQVVRLKLNSTGDDVIVQESLLSNIGVTPLDITAQGDSGAFRGTVWVADHQANAIFVFEPNDFAGGTVGTGADDPTLDEDNDGYNNHDEILNHTNPLSAGDVPPDWDQDFSSNLLDDNDDNDGLPDTSDPFAIDPLNGRGTPLPVNYTWENDAPNPGGLLHLGFTGLMTNGSANYDSLFDPSKMTVIGAAGVVTVDAVPSGTATGASNTQQYGFQFGIDVTASTSPFTAHTRIVAPFAGLTPSAGQSLGMFIGNGDQDNYFKVIVSGQGGVKWEKEVGGVVTTGTLSAVSLPGPEAIDLYLSVNPANATVQARYSVTTNGVTGAAINLGTPVAIPSNWYTGSNGLALGIISTSGSGSAFPATWDFIQVGVDPANAAPVVNAGPDQTVRLPNPLTLQGTVTDDGNPIWGKLTQAWSKVSGPGTVVFSTPQSAVTTVTFSAAGTYVLRLTANDGALGKSDDVTVTVSPQPTGMAVLSFTLINADTDQPIAGYTTLPLNATLNLATLPTRNLNLRANVSGTLKSVRFALDQKSNYSTDNAAPYSLAGDTSGNYKPWTPTVGTHTVKATPYSGSSATGTAGTALTLSFNVIDQAVSSQQVAASTTQTTSTTTSSTLLAAQTPSTTQESTSQTSPTLVSTTTTTQTVSSTQTAPKKESATQETPKAKPRGTSGSEDDFSWPGSL